MTATIPRDFESDPLATPVTFESATLRSWGRKVHSFHEWVHVEQSAAFWQHGLWWPIGPVGRRAAREWSGS